MLIITMRAEVREDDYWDLKNRSLLNFLWNEHQRFNWFEEQGVDATIVETYNGNVYIVEKNLQIDYELWGNFLLATGNWSEDNNSKTKLTVIDTGL